VGEDAAWVRIDTPLGPATLLALLDDPERLLRVNSCWVFEHWRWLDCSRFELRIQNSSNDRLWETSGSVQRLGDGVRLDYREGIKRFTRFCVEPAHAGSRLWLIEDYSRLPEAERLQRLAEVDHSLPRWGEDLSRYLRAWARWSWLPVWRWYIKRVWSPMKPISRRVTRLLLWTACIELFLFLALIAALCSDLGS
jgi:hypothetical protein